MKKSIKSCLSLLLALCIVFSSAAALTSFAANGKEATTDEYVTISSYFGNGEDPQAPRWIIENGNLTIKGTGNTSQAVIPTYADKVVDAIIVEEGIKNIAFLLFDGLCLAKTVSLPSTVTTIGSAAFRNCKSIEEIVIPEGVTTIDDNAFFGCSSLKKVIIPKTVTKIGFNAFANCPVLTDITVLNAGLDLTKSGIGKSSIRFICDEAKKTEYINQYAVVGVENASIDHQFIGFHSAELNAFVEEANGIIYEKGSFSTEGLTVSGYSDSLTEEYTTENNINFHSIGSAASCLWGTFKTGDLIKFGEYPQKLVTDTDIVEKLTESASGKEWTSYKYYYDNEPTDMMEYIDVELNHQKYRGVKINNSRTRYSGCFTSSTSYQKENGYSANNTYWFEYDTLGWRILDAKTGLVLCTEIIDSRSFTDYCGYINSSTTYYGNPEQTYYANCYPESSIRSWLNNDFMDTAFNDSEKEQIKTTVIDNKCYRQNPSGGKNYDDCSDKVYLLKYSDVLNPEYGFIADTDGSATRVCDHTAYAACQGLEVSSNGYAYWMLRTPGTFSKTASVCYVNYTGAVGNHSLPYSTSHGIRPAMNLDFHAGVKTQISGNIPETIHLSDEITLTAKADAAIPDGYKYIWSVDNDNFDIVDNGDNTCRITAQGTGESTISVRLCGAEGEVVPGTKASVTLNVEKEYYLSCDDNSAYFTENTFGGADDSVKLEITDVSSTGEHCGTYISDSGKSYEQIGLFNIRITDSEGRTVQPASGKKVSIKLRLPAAYASRKDISIIHWFEEKGREKFSLASGNLRLENGYAIFEVGSFSEFSICLEPASLAIRNMAKYNGKAIDFKATVTFHAESENCTDIEWYVNGQKVASNSDGSCTLSQLKADIEIHCTAKDSNGNKLESESETITVKHGFFDKIKAFFRGLFGSLPVIDQ